MTSTWRQVAHKDFADAVRSKMIWGIMAVFVLFMVVLLLVAQVAFPEDVEVTVDVALAFVAELSQLFVPLIALIAAYMAIVGERRSGSLRVLLSYPFSRSDVVLGKLIGRGLVVGTALTAGVLITVGVAVLLYGVPEAGKVAGLFGSILLFGLAFAGIGVGISAAMATRGQAMAGVLGLYILFLLFWEVIVGAIYYVVEGTLPGMDVEPWYFLLLRLSPIEAFRSLADATFDDLVTPMIYLGVDDMPADATFQEQFDVSARVAGELPFYLDSWVLVLILLAWGLVPAVVGYLRFRDADLG